MPSAYPFRSSRFPFSFVGIVKMKPSPEGSWLNWSAVAWGALGGFGCCGFGWLVGVCCCGFFLSVMANTLSVKGMEAARLKERRKDQATNSVERLPRHSIHVVDGNQIA
jgi:hypothetical protein